MKQYRKSELGYGVCLIIKAQMTFQDARNKQDIENKKLVRGRPIAPLTFSAYAENDLFLRVPRFYEFSRDCGIPEPAFTFQPPLSPGACATFRFEDGPNSSLRSVQEEALSILLERLGQATPANPQGATLCLPCGFGKTRTAIFAIQRLAVKTLVLASHSHLLVQFSKEAQRLSPDIIVAKLPKKPDTAIDPDAHVIFGTLQSIYCRNYPSRYWDSIGLVVIDEAHHLAAPTFCQAICKLPVCRILALTATPERKDGRENLIYLLAGDTAFRVYRPKDSRVTVKFLRYSPDSLECKAFDSMYQTVGERMLLLGKLSIIPKRNIVLIKKIKKLAPERGGILVLCKLINHLHLLAELCALPPEQYGFFTGQETQQTREASAERRVIFATFDMAKEGLDIPRLDTLVLGSPAENTIQCMGRILREFPGKKNPIVIDVFDDCVAFRGEIWSRVRQYSETGARVTGIVE